MYEPVTYRIQSPDRQCPACGSANTEAIRMECISAHGRPPRTLAGTFSFEPSIPPHVDVLCLACGREWAEESKANPLPPIKVRPEEG
jgi:hypothetical protein